MEFKKIEIPSGWKEAYSAYPNGQTIFEALSATINAVNEGIEDVNQKVNDGILAIADAEATIQANMNAAFATLDTELRGMFATKSGELDAAYLQFTSDMEDNYKAFYSTYAAQLAEKAPQSTTYTKTEVDTKDEVKTDKLKTTNIITNGDFSQGTTGWTLGSGISVISNELVFNVASDNVEASQTIQTVIGRKYYIKANLKAYTSGYLSLRGTGFSGVISTFIPLASTLGTKSVVLACTQNTGLKFITPFIEGFKGTLDDVIALDLTATFGAGNEPTAEQMDRLLAEFPNSWFDGTQEILPLKVLPDIFATKVQEAWITPTLVNSFTEVSGYPVRYMKDSLGFVHLKGRIATGSPGAYAFQLPAGYRPPVNISFISPHGSTSGAIRMSMAWSGAIYVENAYTSYIDLSNIIFATT